MRFRPERMFYVIVSAFGPGVAFGIASREIGLEIGTSFAVGASFALFSVALFRILDALERIADE